ncbi:MAG: hypothetical protein ACRD2I_26550 [Vicinamibacterales bacterium]
MITRQTLMRLVRASGCALMLSACSLSAANAAQAAREVKPFTSAKWGIALEYPAGWSVEDDGDEVTFHSQSGQSIVLGRNGGDSPSEPAPGRQTTRPQCSPTTTAHGVTAIVCVDAVSTARRATLVLKTRDGVQSRLALRSRGPDARTFDAMVSSVRTYP